MIRIALALVFVSAAFPQQRQATPEISSANVPANLPAQKIGANDLISVSVYDAPELTHTIRVGADGCIRLPMVKAKIPVDGKLPVDIEAAIGAVLKSEEIIVDPFVTVTVIEYHSRPINVAGSVKKPITFQAAGPVRLLDAITRAEGLTQEAGPEILVTRPNPRAGADEPLQFIQRIPVKGLIDAADPDLNITLTGGEEIRVPEMGRVFVVGNVRKPGAYAAKDPSETTVLKMLALSEGVTQFSGKQAFIYRKEGGTGNKNEITIEIKKILDRKSPDVPLQANDILYIPDNSGRRTVMSALEKLLMFGTSAGATALVYRGR